MNILRIIGKGVLLGLLTTPLAHADTPPTDDGIYLIYAPSALKSLNSYAAQVGCMSPDEAREHAPAAAEALNDAHLVIRGLEKQPQDLVTALTISGDSTVVLAKGDCAERVSQEWQRFGSSENELNIITLVEGRDDELPVNH